MKKFIWLILLFLAGLLIVAPLLRGCQGPKEKPSPEVSLIQTTPALFVDEQTMDDSPELTKFKKSATALDQYIREQFWQNDGMIPAKLVSNDPDQYALSESYGLYLQSIIATKDKSLFNAAYNVTLSKFRNDQHLSWRYDSKTKTIADADSVIDDLRIVNALFKAYDLWHEDIYKKEALRIASALKAHAIVDGNLVSFYNFTDGKASSEVHIPFLDLGTMARLSTYDKEWTTIKANAETLIDQGYLGDEFPFYNPIFDLKEGKYIQQNAFNMTEGLMTVYHAAQNKTTKLKTIQWLNEQMDKGPIYGFYKHDGTPDSRVESSAIYATIMLIGEALEDPALTLHAKEKLMALQTEKEGIGFNKGHLGAFEDRSSKTAYAYDNLMALWAINEELKKQLVIK